MTPLRGRDSSRRQESLWIGELGPRGFIARTGLGQFKVPWDKSNFLAHIRECAIRLSHLEEFRVGIPQRGECESFDFRGFRVKLGCEIALSSQSRNGGDRLLVSTHIAVAGLATVILLS